MDVFNAVEKTEALFHFHNNPNPKCPISKKVHALLDNKLYAVQMAMQEKMKAITLQGLLDELHHMRRQ